MPANESVWEIFIKLTTQTRSAGMGGMVGFDYGALPVLFAAYGIPQSEWQILIDKLHQLSIVAMKYLNKQSDDRPVRRNAAR